MCDLTHLHVVRATRLLQPVRPAASAIWATGGQAEQGAHERRWHTARLLHRWKPRATPGCWRRASCWRPATGVRCGHRPMAPRSALSMYLGCTMLDRRGKHYLEVLRDCTVPAAAGAISGFLGLRGAPPPLLPPLHPPCFQGPLTVCTAFGGGGCRSWTKVQQRTFEGPRNSKPPASRPRGAVPQHTPPVVWVTVARHPCMWQLAGTASYSHGGTGGGGGKQLEPIMAGVGSDH